MQPIHTLTVNGQTFIIQDPNAATAQQLEQAVDAAKAEIPTLPTKLSVSIFTISPRRV